MAATCDLDKVMDQWQTYADKSDIHGIYDLVIRYRSECRDVSGLVKLLTKSVELFDQIDGVEDSIIGRLHVFAGLEIAETDRARAIDHFSSALHHYLKAYSPRSIKVHSVYFHLAQKHFLNGAHDQATNYLDTALSLQQELPKTYNWVRSLLLMARLYSYKGELGKMRMTLEMMKPYLDHFQESLGTDYYYIINAVAEILKDNNLPEESVALLRSIAKRSTREFFTFSQLGQALFKLNEVDSALFYFEKTIPFLHQFDYYEEAWIKTHISNCHFRMDSVEVAMRFLDEIEMEKLSTFQKIPFLVMRAHAYSALGRLEPAIGIYEAVENQVLSENLEPFAIVDFFSNYVKCKYSHWRETQILSDLELTAELVSRADSVVRALRYSLSTPDARQNYMKACKMLYDFGIKTFIDLELYKNSSHAYDVIHLMEINKSMVLAEEFAEKRDRLSEKLKYRDKYRQLRSQMRLLQDPSEHLALSDSIYYWLRLEESANFSTESLNTLSSEDYAKIITGDLIHVNYYQHQDTGLTIAVCGGGIEKLVYRPEPGWFALITRYLKGIHQIEDSVGIGESTYLREILLPFELEKDQNKLNIIPDGILANIPFECLKDSNGRPLIEDLIVSYDFSLTMKGQVEVYSRSSGSGLIFAPEFKTVSDDELFANRRNGVRLMPLKYNQLEAENIASIFKESKMYLAQDATHKSFSSIVGEAPFIHIATHAFGPGEGEPEGRIIFDQTESDFSVNISDIYNSRLHTDMVVMSACETAVGEYIPGEGVMSFARAFTAAGSKSVVASLWSVNDRSTAEIMTSFYQYLKSGVDKDEALRLSKLDYLENADPGYKHPFYWAGFVAIGDMSPLRSSFLESLLLWILAPVIILPAIYFYKWKRRPG